MTSYGCLFADKQVRSDNDASEVDILGHFGTLSWILEQTNIAKLLRGFSSAIKDYECKSI